MSIILSNKPGQLGNRLILHAHFICFGAEYGIKIYNPPFDEYRRYFKTQINLGIFFNHIYYLFSYYLARILGRLHVNNSLISCKHINWNETVTLEKKEGNDFLFSKFCFVQGWQYRNNSLLQKHRELVLNVFTPQTVYTEQLENYFKNNFSPDNVIIGVHIRRGDYKTFENGKYFYELEDYRKFMHDVSDCFRGKNLKFLIATNDKEAATFFENSNINCVMAPGHELLDMYSLARCYYIIGPPSTYTLWASFYGEVPLQMLYSKDHEIKKEKFEVTKYF